MTSSEIAQPSGKELEIFPILSKGINEPLFPVAALGSKIGSAVNLIQDVLQAPTSLIAQSCLASALFAVHAHINVEMDGRVHPCNDFFTTIADSGERKSAVDSIALIPHRVFEQRLWKEYRQNIKAGNAGNPLSNQPQTPFLVSEDPTIEGIIKLLVNNRPTHGIFSDEGGKLLGGHSMKAENRTATIAALNSFWDGRSLNRIRASEAPIQVPPCRVTLHIMIQPSLAEMLLSNTQMIGQGLLARMLIVQPASTAGSRMYKEINLLESPEVQNYHNSIADVLNIPLPLDPENQLAPRIIGVDSEAKKLFIDFYNNTERQSGRFDALAPIRGFSSKSLEHALRLAASLTFFHDQSATEISLKWAENSIELCSFYLQEQLRLQVEYSPPQHLRDAQEVLEWLISKRKIIIGLGEFLQYGPHRLRAKDKALGVMKVLEECNRAIRSQEGLHIDGRWYRTAWQIRFLPGEI